MLDSLRTKSHTNTMDSTSQDDTGESLESQPQRKKMFCKSEARAGIPQRKVLYRLYPNVTQTSELEAHLALHCRLYNTVLADRIQAYKDTGKGLSFADQAKHLTGWRKSSAGLALLNAQSEQVTLRRADLAFQGFFRRVKSGAEAKGFPRFKSLSRYKGWGYKSYGDGWSIQEFLNDNGEHTQHPRCYLQGITGTMRLRGKARNEGTPVTAEVLRKQGKWYISITYDCKNIRRARGDKIGAFDINLGEYLTLGTLDAATGEIDIDKVENPRWMRKVLPEIKRLSKSISRKQTALDKAQAKRDAEYDLMHIESAKKAPRIARSKRLKAEIALLAKLLSKIARIRKDFLHKLSASLIAEYAVLGTEVLNTAIMLVNKKEKKEKTSEIASDKKPFRMSKKAVHGLHREMASIAPATFLAYVKYKAEEADTWYVEMDTRQLKPSQRCHGCWVAFKKTLNQRVHRCPCGITCNRDDNSVATMLRHLYGSLSVNGQRLADGTVADFSEPTYRVRLKPAYTDSKLSLIV